MSSNYIEFKTSGEDINHVKTEFEDQVRRYFIRNHCTILIDPEVYYDGNWRLVAKVKRPNGKTYDIINTLEFTTEGLELPFRPARKCLSLRINKYT